MSDQPNQSAAPAPPPSGAAPPTPAPATASAAPGAPASAPTAAAPPPPSVTRFFPVPVDALDHAVLQMDLYIKYNEKGAHPTLYRSAGLEFNAEDRQRLIDQKVKFVYVSAGQHHIFRKALSDRLDRTFADPSQKVEERSRVVREACSKMIEDVLLFPGDPEPIAAVTDISKNFTEWSSTNPEGFSYLLNMSSHDFYTATHMVNVGVGCGLLAKELFPNDRELFTLCVQGGLLHDIGKRNVPPEILNKEGKLSPEEWKVISSHPTFGYEEVRQNPAIPPAVLHMIRDHHERLDGKGYPAGLTGEAISREAKICAVIDVFDAITAARPYRGPTPPADTLRMMRDGRGTQFDAEMFDAWAAVVMRMIEADPARAPASTGKVITSSLDSMQAQSPAWKGPDTSKSDEARPAVDLYKEERRRYKRYEVNINAGVRVVRAGKKLPVLPGENFLAKVLDFSRGGAQICTPWPLSINDLLSIDIELPGPGNKKITRLSKVVRVRSTPDGQWAAGLAFLESEAEAV